MDDRRIADLEPSRNRAWLAVIVASSALALAVLGLFGVTAFSVIQRRHEMSIRVSLGARAGQILALLLRDTLTPVLAGMTIGVTCALFGSQFVRSLSIFGAGTLNLFGLPSRDPLAIGAAVMVLLLAAVAAVWVPTRRGANVDPAETLKRA